MLSTVIRSEYSEQFEIVQNSSICWFECSVRLCTVHCTVRSKCSVRYSYSIGVLRYRIISGNFNSSQLKCTEACWHFNYFLPVCSDLYTSMSGSCTARCEALSEFEVFGAVQLRSESVLYSSMSWLQVNSLDLFSDRRGTCTSSMRSCADVLCSSIWFVQKFKFTDHQLYCSNTNPSVQLVGGVQIGEWTVHFTKRYPCLIQSWSMLLNWVIRSVKLFGSINILLPHLLTHNTSVEAQVLRPYHVSCP